MPFVRQHRRRIRKSLFFPAKHKRLASIVTIKSPSAFRNSIRKLKKNGLSTREKRALILARNRAEAMLKRANLSDKERRQMKEISKIRV